MDDNRTEKEYIEKLVRLNRVAKVVKGGRRFSFSALVVVGDQKGRVGFGFGKANDVSEAIKKSLEKAKKNVIMVNLQKNTIPHMIIGKYKSARVILKPAAPGTGVIAGGPVRAVMDAVGVKDILSKSLGSDNSMNILKAVFNGFGRLMNAKKIAQNRNKTVQEIWG
ncbi:MAG: 30S ribosomal protein S5 [Spirochaetales bacterium]|nr:30S ribosomal protein S5 [Spirochaetales bacterium]